METVRKKIQDELDLLLEEMHFGLPKEIQKAREFGDLRENAEYKAALERQLMVSARIGHLRLRLSELQDIDLSKIPTDSAAYGSKLILYDLDRDVEVTYRLVTSEESNPDEGLISTVSPIGQALMGKEQGDEVIVRTEQGIRKFEIAKLYTIHEKQETEK